MAAISCGSGSVSASTFQSRKGPVLDSIHAQSRRERKRTSWIAVLKIVIKTRPVYSHQKGHQGKWEAPKKTYQTPKTPYADRTPPICAPTEYHRSCPPYLDVNFQHTSPSLFIHTRPNTLASCGEPPSAEPSKMIVGLSSGASLFGSKATTSR